MESNTGITTPEQRAQIRAMILEGMMRDPKIYDNVQKIMTLLEDDAEAPEDPQQ